MNTVDEKRCPLCGALNQCTMAARPADQRDKPVPCWCTNIGVPMELRERIPPELRMKACICKNCIEAFKAQQEKAE